MWLGVALAGACLTACETSTRAPTATATSGSGSSAQPVAAGPSAKLSVLVRTADRRMEPVAVEEKGALPVKDGGAMYLEVQLPRPAFVYLVWIDCRGRVLPLYPWNNQELEVADVDQPPPVRRATDRVFSPLLGRDWAFAEGKGTEIVLLLVRREALPADVKLGALLQEIATDSFQTPRELSKLGLAPDKRTLVDLLESGAGTETPATGDEALAKAMRALGEHFDEVQAVCFAHGG